MNKFDYDICIDETVSYFKSIGENISVSFVKDVVPFVHAKTVLVICSDAYGRDYPNPENQKMLKKY